MILATFFAAVAIGAYVGVAVGVMCEEYKDSTYRRVNALRRMGRAYGSWEAGA